MPLANQRVTDPKSAAKAIGYIVYPGEGTADSPKFDGTGQFAHYRRFSNKDPGL